MNSQNIETKQIEVAEKIEKKLSTREVAQLLEKITKDGKIDEIDNSDLKKLLHEYSSIKERHKDFLLDSLKQALKVGYTIKGKESYEILSGFFKQITKYDFPKYEDIISKNENMSDFIVSLDGSSLIFYEVGDGDAFAKIDLKSGNKLESINSFFYIDDYSFNNNKIYKIYKTSIKDLKEQLSETTDELERKQLELEILKKEKDYIQSRLDSYTYGNTYGIKNDYLELNSKKVELERKIKELEESQTKSKENQEVVIESQTKSKENEEITDELSLFKVNEILVKLKGKLTEKLNYIRLNEEQIKSLQIILNIINGDENLVVDGKFGESTYKAVQKYQNSNGLQVDGKPGINTLGSLLNNKIFVSSLNKNNNEKVS